MKRLMIAFLVCVMVLATSVTALGAVHDSRGDFWNIPVNENVRPYNTTSMGGWFYVGADAPFIQVSYANSTTGDPYDDDGYLNMAAETWKNDFTFLEGSQYFVADEYGYNPAYVNGSYLLGNNLFFGMSSWYGSYNSDDFSALVSIGYKFDINEKFWAALSLDYYFDSDANVVGYEVTYRYTGEMTRIFGQLYWVSDDFADDPNWDDLGDACVWFDFNINYQLSERFVLGGRIASYDQEEEFMLGFSWYGDSLTIDLKYVSFEDNDESLIAGSLMYALNKTSAIGVGWESYSADDAAGLILKGRFAAFCDGEAQIGYRIYNEEIDYAGTGITLTWMKKL